MEEKINFVFVFIGKESKLDDGRGWEDVDELKNEDKKMGTLKLM